VFERFFSYDHISGGLYWKERHPGNGLTQKNANRFNSRYAGRIAGSLRGQNKPGKGYLAVKISAFGTSCSMDCHRICFALYHGYLPDYIDHFDGVGKNNKISNLRPVTKSLNARNRVMKIISKSGVVGVYCTGTSFRAYAGPQRSIKLGKFADIFDAICARKSYEYRSGYTLRHGAADIPKIS